MVFLIPILAAFVAYTVGSVNGAIIASRLIYKDDVRNHGSKNAGLTNFIRTYGKKSALMVLLIDILKSAVPIFLAGLLFMHFLDFATAEERLLIGRAFAGLCTMLGHCYPLFYQFRGGKGVLSGATTLFFVSLPLFGILLTLFVLIVVFTRYISLGSVLAGLLFPIGCFFFDLPLMVIVLAALCGGLLIMKHHENIARLIKGTENKFSLSRKREDKQ